MNLVSHESNYDLRRQIMRHLNPATLYQIVNQYLSSKPIENDKYFIIEQDQEKIGKKPSYKKNLISYVLIAVE